MFQSTRVIGVISSHCGQRERRPREGTTLTNSNGVGRSADPVHGQLSRLQCSQLVLKRFDNVAARVRAFNLIVCQHQCADDGGHFGVHFHSSVDKSTTQRV